MMDVIIFFGAGGLAVLLAVYTIRELAKEIGDGTGHD